GGGVMPELQELLEELAGPLTPLEVDAVRERAAARTRVRRQGRAFGALAVAAAFAVVLAAMSALRPQPTGEVAVGQARTDASPPTPAPPGRTVLLTSPPADAQGGLVAIDPASGTTSRVDVKDAMQGKCLCGIVGLGGDGAAYLALPNAPTYQAAD